MTEFHNLTEVLPKLVLTDSKWVVEIRHSSLGWGYHWRVTCAHNGRFVNFSSTASTYDEAVELIKDSVDLYERGDRSRPHCLKGGSHE